MAATELGKKRKRSHKSKKPEEAAVAKPVEKSRKKAKQEEPVDVPAQASEDEENEDSIDVPEAAVESTHDEDNEDVDEDNEDELGAAEKSAATDVDDLPTTNTSMPTTANPTKFSEVRLQCTACL